MDIHDVTMADVPDSLAAATVFMGSAVTAAAVDAEQHAINHLLKSFRSEGAPGHDPDAPIRLVLPSTLAAAAEGDAQEWLKLLRTRPASQYAVPVPHYVSGGPWALWGLVTVDLRNMKAPTVSYHAPTDDAALAAELWDDAENKVQPLLNGLVHRDGRQIGFDYSPRRLADKPLTPAESLQMVLAGACAFPDSAVPDYDDIMDQDMPDAAYDPTDQDMPDPGPAIQPLGPGEWMSGEDIASGLETLRQSYPGLHASTALLSPAQVQLVRAGEDSILSGLFYMGTRNVMLPINDRPLSYEEGGSEGQHWSLLILQEVTSKDESGLLSWTIKGYHYDSLSDGATAEEHRRIATQLTSIASRCSGASMTMTSCTTTQQKNGHQCGDHVLATAGAIMEQLSADPDSAPPLACAVTVPDRDASRLPDMADTGDQAATPRPQMDLFGYPKLSEEEFASYVEDAETQLGNLKDHYKNLLERNNGARRPALSEFHRDVSNTLQDLGCPTGDGTRLRYRQALISKLADESRSLDLSFSVINDGYVPQLLEPVAERYCKEVEKVTRGRFGIGATLSDRVKHANQAKPGEKSDALRVLIASVAKGDIPGFTIGSARLRVVTESLTAADLVVFCNISTSVIDRQMLRPIRDAYDKRIAAKILRTTPRHEDETDKDYMARVFEAADEMGIERASEVLRLTKGTIEKLGIKLRDRNSKLHRYCVGNLIKDKELGWDGLMRRDAGEKLKSFLRNLPGVRECTNMGQVMEIASEKYDDLSDDERSSLNFSRAELHLHFDTHQRIKAKLHYSAP